MQRNVVFLLLGFVAIVNAHFQLQFPPPRGAFVENNEPNFCDGYMTPAANRSQFPLTGGFFSLNSEHPKWTAGVLLSTAANPTSFDNFSQVVPFFQLQGEGKFCIPLNFTAGGNSTNLKDGQNVTIQCADLTLSNSFKISSDVSCTNATNNGGNSGGNSGDNSGSNGQTTSGSAAHTISWGLMLGIFTTMVALLSQ